MKITKLGHCCLLVETKGKRILTDPGSFTAEASAELTNLDAIFYTHEHFDHFHLESLQVILAHNPQAQIYTNTSVSDLLEQAEIPHTVICDGESVQIGEIAVTGHGVFHAEIHASIPRSANTGYFFDNQFFYPGDAFIDPEKPVDILALPVAGPWLKISESIDYALKLHPRIAFPVHDFVSIPAVRILPATILPKNGIEFIPLEGGQSYNFS